jgi:hypothetical protein
MGNKDTYNTQAKPNDTVIESAAPFVDVSPSIHPLEVTNEPLYLALPSTMQGNFQSESNVMVCRPELNTTTQTSVLTAFQQENDFVNDKQNTLKLKRFNKTIIALIVIIGVMLLTIIVLTVMLLNKPSATVSNVSTSTDLPYPTTADSQSTNFSDSAPPTAIPSLSPFPRSPPI